MRVLKVLFFAALALLALASPAAAQFQYGPGGAIVTGTSEVNASGQVATAQSIIPSGMTTTQTALCSGVVCRLDVSGILATRNGSPGTLTPAFSYGGVAVSFSARSLETALNNVPWRLNCFIAPDSTVAAGSGGITGKALDCEFSYVTSNTQGGTLFVARALATGTITATATQTMAASLTFSDTTSATGAIARRQVFTAGI